MSIIFHYMQMAITLENVNSFGFKSKPKPDFYTAQVFIFVYLGLKRLLSTLVTKTLIA